MSAGTIVLTGATGFCGFAILQAALKADYSLRIVVRSTAKADSLRSNTCFQSLNKASQCTFYVVPDLSIEGSLDEATAGADYMIHTASPLPFTNLALEPAHQWKELVEPAIKNTISALESAKRSKSVKRVVMTSSCAIFITPELLSSKPLDKPVVVTEEDINPPIEPPYASILVAYVASKTSAFLQSKQWIQDHTPAFDVVNLCPTYVQGRNELATSPTDLMTTSNVLFLRMALGLAPKDSPAEVASVVHIDDVAAVHIAALQKTRIPAGEYLFGQQVQWNDVNEITKRLFVEQVQKGLLPCTADVPTKPVVCSKEKTERTFGIQLKGVESMVTDVVGQYLELTVAKDD
jgi:nucleoside-diphosphate-sugar epimerase